MYEPGSAISSSGALTAYSGKKTGRSPLDKRIVQEPGSEKDIWWGPVNKPMSTDVRFPSCGVFSLFFLCLGVTSTALPVLRLGHTTELRPMTNPWHVVTSLVGLNAAAKQQRK